MNYSLIFITILIIILIGFYITNKINKIESYVIDSNNEGPVLLLLAGTHGNEPAGSYALEKFINSKINISRGKIIIIPRVNKIGLFFGTRYGFNSVFPIDYNRNYPIKLNEIGKDCINQQIIQYVHKADFILDFHEGWGFNIIEPKSMGSGIYPSNTTLSKNIAQKMLYELNKNILDPNKKFTIGFDSPRILHTLDYFCDKNNKDYILVETSGQNNIQPLDLRVKQVIKVIKVALKNLLMI